jgi:hypothetical protein
MQWSAAYESVVNATMEALAEFSLSLRRRGATLTIGVDFLRSMRSTVDLFVVSVEFVFQDCVDYYAILWFAYCEAFEFGFPVDLSLGVIAVKLFRVDSGADAAVREISYLACSWRIFALC